MPSIWELSLCGAGAQLALAAPTGSQRTQLPWVPQVCQENEPGGPFKRLLVGRHYHYPLYH